MSFANVSKFDRFTDKLIKLIFGRKIYGVFVDKSNIIGDEYILDFGCGSGGVSTWLLPKLRRGGHILALDTSKAWLDVAIERLHGGAIEFTTIPIEKLDVKMGPFDKIFIHFMLHDISVEKRPDIANNLSKFLDTGGELIIREPTRNAHGMPAEEIDRLFTNAGLEKINSESGKMFLINPYYFAIFKKTEKER